MAAIKIVQVAWYDAGLLVEQLRDEDRAEVEASGQTVLDAIVGSIRASAGSARALYIDDQLAAFFGTVPCSFLTGFAIPWALTTPVVDRYPKAFWVACKHEIDDMRRQYKLLVNHVDARYEKALRWAKRLGFQVSSPQPYGPRGELFCQITLRGV